MSASIASSLDKALALLFAFANPEDTRQIFTVSALAEQLNMDKAQVSRVLATFAKYGLVERLENRRGYQLGWSIVPLASRALTAQTMSAVYPELSRLSTELGETVTFSVRDNASSVCLASFKPDRRLFVAQSVGQMAPLIGSAVGYALLSRSQEPDVRALFDAAKARSSRLAGRWVDVRAGLRGVSESGVSVVRDEFGEQVTTVAAPIFDVGNYQGRVYGAIALSAPDDRFAEREAHVLERLAEVAEVANQAVAGREYVP